MNLKQQREAALKAARDIAEKAKGESRDMTAEEVAEVDQHLAKADDLATQIKAADESQTRMKRLAEIKDPAADERGTAPEAKTVGEQFVKSVGDRLVQAKASGERFSVAGPEFKVATDTHLVGTAFNPVTVQVDTNIVQGLRRRLQIADLLSQGTLSGNAITYYVEGALEGDFTTVAEGAAKPQIHYADPTTVTEALKKIAAFIKESDEMIEDLPFLVSAINNRLLYNLALFEENQVLNGNGAGTNLMGLLNRSGVQSLGVVGDAKAGNADQIFRAMTSVTTGSGLDADGLVIHPTDYQTFRLNKDANGQYYGGGYFQGQYGAGAVAEQPPLWGLRTVITPAIPAGTVLVGAFQQSSTLYRKGGVRVESTNSEGNDFTTNRVTVRAEERVALAVRRPAGLVKVTLGTV